VVVVALARAAIVDAATALMAAAAAILIVWLGVNSAWVILAAGILGLAM